MILLTFQTEDFVRVIPEMIFSTAQETGPSVARANVDSDPGDARLESIRRRAAVGAFFFGRRESIANLVQELICFLGIKMILIKLFH